MSIEDRIKKVRKHKGLNQKDFAEKIGIGQAGLSAIEKGLRGVTDRNISLICEKFNVNECWLRTGEGSIFNETVSDIIDELAKQYDFDELDCRLVTEYAKLNKEQRLAIKSYIKNVLQIDEIAAVKENLNPNYNNMGDFDLDTKDGLLAAVAHEYDNEKTKVLLASQDTDSKEDMKKKIS